MKWYVGTSGYSYKEWKGNFYPDKLPQKEMLEFYASKLSTVEINNTFYRMPRASMVEEWATRVPDTFRFVFKASQRITHFKRLKNCEDETGYLLNTVSAIGDRLGAVLFQMPPNMKKDIDRLRDFLTTLPRGTRAAFEFRHPSWRDNDVFEALRASNLAWCIADTEKAEDAPIVSTADWGYLRLRRPDYDEAGLHAWVARILDEGWRHAFVFFKHEDEGAGPRMAAALLRAVGSDQGGG